MEDANNPNVHQPAHDASAQPFDPTAPAFRPKIQSQQDLHHILSQGPVSTPDLYPPQMAFLSGDFSDMRGRFSAFTAPFIQVKPSQSRIFTGVSGASLFEPAIPIPTPPHYIVPTPSGVESCIAHSTQAHIQAPSTSAAVGQSQENTRALARAPVQTRNILAEKGALALWSRAERETAERDPEGWIALARQEFDRLQEVYKPGSIPSEVLEAHLTKYAAAYPRISETQDKTSTSATTTKAITAAAPPPVDNKPSEMTPVPDTPRHQNLQKLVPGIDSRGRVIMTASMEAGAEAKDQAVPGQFTTPTKPFAGPSAMAPTADEFSPGPAFPALGTHPGRKAADKPGETIQIPYPGGPVSHNPRKTMPRPPQGPAALLKTATPLEAFIIPGPGRLRVSKRPKRTDQGPLPSQADIYPDDSNLTSEVGSAERSIASGDTGVGSRTPRHRRNTSGTASIQGFSSPHDRRISVSSATKSGFTPERGTQASYNLMGTEAPTEICPPSSGAYTHTYHEGEGVTPSYIGTTDTSGAASLMLPATSGQTNPSMNLMAAFSQLAQFSAQQAQYHSQLSAIQEEGTFSPSATISPVGPASMNLRGGESTSVANAIPDGISDIQKISPVSATMVEIPTPRSRQVPAPRLPIGNTYYRGLGQKQTVLLPKTRDLEPDQLDGSRYGIELGGLGLQSTRFIWNPPRPDRSTPLGRMGYLWGQP